MNRFLMFLLGGISVVVLAIYAGNATNPLDFYAGVVCGAITMSFLMYFFAKNVGKQVVKELNDVQEVEVIDEAEKAETDDTIYDDVDWWKDDEKRKKHLRDMYE